MSQYTKEPWYVAHHSHIYADGHLHVGSTSDPIALSGNPIKTQADNARRIVACVNACAGISTETLELDGGSIGFYKSMAANANQQRDELLSAIKDAHCYISSVSERKRIGELIMKFEGGAE